MGSSPVCAAGDVTAEDQLALIWTKHTAAAAGKAKTNTCSTQQSPNNTRPTCPVASCEPTGMSVAMERSFAMESAMSGYSQKMLLKLKVLMHKEQFCDVEIIVQVPEIKNGSLAKLY